MNHLTSDNQMTGQAWYERGYSHLFHSIRDAILIANIEREIINCNTAFTDLFGYSLEEIKGKQTHKVYSSMEEYEQMGEKLKQHMTDPKFTIVIEYKTKTGDTFPGETAAHYLRDDNHQVLGFIGIIRDVTEKQQMEREICDKQQRLERAEEIAHLGSWEMDIASGEVKWSEEFYRICGITPDDMDPSPDKWFEIIHPDDRENAIRKFEQCVKSGEPYDIEIRILRPDGSIRHVQSIGEILTDDGGKQSKLIGALLDITEPEINKQELRSLKENLEVLVEKRTQQLQEKNERLHRFQRLLSDAEKLASVGAIFGDLVQDEWVVSEEWRNIHGIESENIRLSTLLKLVYSDDKEKYEKELINNMEKGGQFEMNYRIAQPKNGEIRYIQSIMHVDFGNRKTSPRKIYGASKDVTAEKRLERRLREKNVALREVLHQLGKETETLRKTVQVNIEQSVMPMVSLIEKELAQNNEELADYVRMFKKKIRQITFSGKAPVVELPHKLTQREKEICTMIANGWRTKQIANMFNISERTVETHRQSIRKKLDIKNTKINLATFLKNLLNI